MSVQTVWLVFMHEKVTTEKLQTMYTNLKGCQDVLSSEDLKKKKMQESIFHINPFLKKSRYVCMSMNTSHRWSPLSVYICTANFWTSVGENVNLGMGLGGRHLFLKLCLPRVYFF